jgi:ribose 5-phosphate isomerase RpiB
MKIALINENSQAPKNSLIFETLKGVAEPLGPSCFNYGRYSAEDPHERTYVQGGILAAILLNSGAADFVITGCGTGMGAMLACNSFPNVICGWAGGPLDAFLFRQVNNGNALSIPYSLRFGWGAELDLGYLFEKLLSREGGGGYPPEWAAAEKGNKAVLDTVKSVTYRDILDILKDLDRDLLKGALAEESFPELFFAHCQVPEIADYIRALLG